MLDSGAPVYMYEFQHSFNEVQKKRPSFVGTDHADEIHFVFGSCFLNGHSKINGKLKIITFKKKQPPCINAIIKT